MNLTQDLGKRFMYLHRTEDVLHQLTVWLLSDRVLQPVRSGAGVANWLWPDGIHDGLYPEICGYYLQFLALAASSRDNFNSQNFNEMPVAVLKDAALRVVEWLDEIAPTGEPLTLYHRDPTQSDWRNKCLFAFDLGMIYRGFDAVERQWPSIVPDELMRRYRTSLSSITWNGRLLSHRLRSDVSDAKVPVKWSTQIDVHHVKIAAAIAGTGPQMADAVWTTIADQAQALAREGSARMRELHPFLYSVEGWLMLWGQAGVPVFLDHADTAFQIVLTEFNSCNGTLPPIAGRTDLASRADVLAQALRAGLILEQAGRLDVTSNSSWSLTRDKLKQELLSRVTPEGGIEFDRIGQHRNVWASLFAWQALHFLIQSGNGSLDAREAAASLI